MKNLIIAVSILFAVSANAQAKKALPAKAATKAPVAKEVVQQKLTPDEAAKKDMKALLAYVSVPAEKHYQIESLFKTKHRMLTESGELSAQRKAIVAQSIERKLASALDANAMEKIKSNKALFLQLVN